MQRKRDAYADAVIDFDPEPRSGVTGTRSTCPPLPDAVNLLPTYRDG